MRCLQLDYPYDQVKALAAEDRVLAAALAHRGLGRGKLYPDLFEALCGVVCARRTSFARIYGMMRKLAEALGEPTAETVDGTTVYAFPTPVQMAAASGAQLRRREQAHDGQGDGKGGVQAARRARPPGDLGRGGLGLHTPVVAPQPGHASSSVGSVTRTDGSSSVTGRPLISERGQLNQWRPTFQGATSSPRADRQVQPGGRKRRTPPEAAARR